MAELVPVPLPLLLRRAFLEYQREGKIFDLPKTKFYRGLPGVDTSVEFHGHRAATPIGPAAGPHDQLAQNIALCWLGGARIIELKTVQILDELDIPRPCIDATNVAYNVEWSQELKLEQSLREYVSASMFIEILKASKLLGDDLPEGWGDTVFDMSVGYNLEGIRSSRVRAWIGSMKDAGSIIDDLRRGLTGAFARYRDLPFNTAISDSIALSTFHGCPAEEIESIAAFLLTDMDCHVTLKLNPTLLGRTEVEHLLHDVLGYREIELDAEAFDKDLQFDEALQLIPRLQRVAHNHGKQLSVKFSNTLVVKNHRKVFSDDKMYLSGPPLHVLAMNLVKKFRDRSGNSVPVSFSAGIDSHNVAGAVAMNLVPVTMCTDLLKPGGYGRLYRYMENLGAKMTELGAANIPEFILRYAGETRDLNTATLRNTARVSSEATSNPRYGWQNNKGVPRKIGATLWLYDCISCDKCVPVCPNDANFVYEADAAVIAYDNLELSSGGMHRVPGGILRLVKSHQIANYAGACNECGNCDVFCPEDGRPYATKPRFFGSLEAYKKHAKPNGFYIAYGTEHKTIYGTFEEKSYRLILRSAVDYALFSDGNIEIEFEMSTTEPLSWKGNATRGIIDMLPYLKLKLLAESVSDPKHVHFANVESLPEPQFL